MPGSPKWCPSGLPTKTPSPLSTNPYALHALPISFPLLSPERQCVSSTDHSAPHYGPQFYVSYVFIVTHRLSLGSTTLVVGFPHSSTFCGLSYAHALSGGPACNLYDFRSGDTRFKATLRFPECLLPLHAFASTVQYSRVQYSTVQYSTVQCSTLKYSAVQHSRVHYSTVEHSTVQYSAVEYSIIQYSKVQHSTVQ